MAASAIHFYPNLRSPAAYVKEDFQKILFFDKSDILCCKKAALTVRRGFPEALWTPGCFVNKFGNSPSAKSLVRGSQYPLLTGLLQVLSGKRGPLLEEKEKVFAKEP